MPNDNSITTDLSPVENVVDKSISLENVNSANVRKTTSESSYTEVLTVAGPGYVVGQLLTQSLSGVTAEMRFFDGSIADENKIGHGKAGANSRSCVTCGLTPFLSTLRVDGKSDGFNEIEMLISIIPTGVPGDTTINSDTDTALLSAAPNTNYQSLTTCPVSVDAGGNADEVALIKFDLSSLPFGRTLSSATFSITDRGGTATASDLVEIHAVLEDWELSQATWNDRKTSIAWNTAGMGSGTDFRASVDATIPGGVATGFRHVIDVTSLVQEWIDGSLTNYGIVLRPASGWGGLRTHNFDSSNNTQGSPDPQLSVVFA